MAKPVFNPDDFVFTKLDLPEDNPTLIEYDAKNRLIYVRIKNPSDEYEYNAVYLTEQINDNLLTYLPDEWTNENDRILLFAVHKNGKVILEKEKLKYNFETKETYWVKYSQKNFTEKDAKEIFDALKAAVFAQNTKDQTERNNNLVSIAKKDLYMDRIYLSLRDLTDKMLRESDWRILPDAPQKFEGEKDLWIEWRNHIRDCVKKPSDFETELDFLIWTEEFKWPINPEQYHSLYPDHDIEYLSTREQFTTQDPTITEEKLDKITEQLNIAIQDIKRQKESGVPITKEMYDVIRRYKLIENVKDLEDLKFDIGGEQ